MSVTNSVASNSPRNSNIGSLYPYKNDPRNVKKGIYVTNVRTYMGGYLPLLDDKNYDERKVVSHMVDNYDYDDKIHHGYRPMHQSTLDLNYQNRRNDFVTTQQLVNKK